jgi:hypothetical protein
MLARESSFPFRGKVGMGVGAKPVEPTPTLALPLKGRELVCLDTQRIFLK